MRKCLFPVYRLAVDAKPVGWWCSGLKISELAQGFSDGYAINGSQRHSHQQQGVYLGFCQSVIILNDNTSSTFLNDNTDNRDNRNRKGNLCCYRCLCCLYQKLSSKKSGATWNYSRKRHPKRRNYSRKLAWKGKNTCICICSHPILIYWL